MPLLSCTIFHTQCSFPTNPATVSLLDGYREYAFTFAHEMREEMTKLLAQGFKVWWPFGISYTPLSIHSSHNELCTKIFLHLADLCGQQY